MTPEQLATVAATAADVHADPERFAAAFYDHLFSVAPAARALFPDDMRAQRAKLTDEMVFLAGAARDLDGFVARARDLGGRHRHYGVRAHDYEAVGAALLVALRAVLGDRFTRDVDEAWRRLYRLVSETMMEGAAGALFAGS